MDIEEAFKIFGKPNPVPPNLPGDNKKAVIIIIAVVAIGVTAYLINKKINEKKEQDKKS